MGAVVANPGTFISGLERYEERLEKMFRNKVRTLVSEGMRRLIAKTPVHTGQAVANYVATGGAPYGGPVKAGGDPEKGTNAMPLGPERNRGGAAAAATATVATVDFSDPYKVFYITNRAPHIGGLESGALPKAPYTPRSPAGMFAITVQELMALLSSGSI
ncbi:hypothetical protein MAL1_00072 [Bacteriophage DSS3_MAL1]|nr:hypothetical protein MAL1_00072 [Bacteriophage DSS3_MAL1]